MKILKLVLIALFFLTSCGNDNNVDLTCKAILVDSKAYSEAISDDFDPIEINFDGACLEITVAYGGGCQEVSAELIAQDLLMLSNPPQMNLKFVLEDNDLCKAAVRKTFYFDTQNLKSVNFDTMILNFENFPEPFTLRY